MTELERAREVLYTGLFTWGQPAIPVFVDQGETGTSFTLAPGETIGMALDRITKAFATREEVREVTYDKQS